MLIICFMIIFLLSSANSFIANNEYELNDLLNKNENELLLNINSQIIINESLNIKKTYQKISFIGNSFETSKLLLSNVTNQIYFNENVKEIEFKNISIIGKLYFDNNNKISISNTNIEGYIDSYMNENNYIELSNVSYKPGSISINNCINISGNVDIYYSEFIGNNLCMNRLINFYGQEKYKLNIKNSYFNGEYSCSGLNIENGLEININESSFENFYSNESNDGGSVIKIINSKSYINHCIFKNNLAINKGGSLYLKDNLEFEINYSDFYNTTSIFGGCVAYITAESDIKSVAKFKNIYQQDTGGYGNIIKEGGLILFLDGYASVDLENFKGKNFSNYYHGGRLLVLSAYSKINIRNFEADHVRGSAIDGLFLYSANTNDVTIKASNVTLNDFYQYYGRETGILIWLNQNTNVNLENVTVTNSGGLNAMLIYMNDYCNVKINNLIVDEYYSKSAIEFIYYNVLVSDKASLSLNNIKLNNIGSQGVLIRASFGNISITNSEIKNMHTCNFNDECNSIININPLIASNEIGLLTKQTELIIKNTTFVNVNGVNGFTLREGTNVEFYNNTLIDCYFKNGFIEIDVLNEKSGSYVIENSSFINNKSEYGTIVNVKSLDDISKSYVYLKNSNFKNNTAFKQGGIVYSNSPKTTKYINISDCHFINNHATFGNDIYSYNINSEPNISNIEELRKINGSIATNPTKIKLNNPNKIIHLLSGDKLPEGISCSIYDDYDHLIFFKTDIANIEFNEFMFFSIEINDTYNAALLGQTKSYCWGDSCLFPQIKVIGNPGIYSLRLLINSFGQYNEFENNFIDISVEIKECDNPDYLYQDIENIKFKSCYLPKCDMSCNTGKCININLCNCNGTLYTGSNCNELFKLERIGILDNSVRVIVSILLLSTLIIIFSTLYYRKEPLIKGGSIQFLITILLGSIISYSYVVFLTYERTKIRCYMIFFLNNIGFSLVFGSILVKTLRIYLIYRIMRKNNYGLKISTMFIIIFLILSFHLVIGFIWIITDGVEAKPEVTNDKKEYLKCSYPKYRILSILLNYSVLLIGFFLSYSIRFAKKNFKEDLAIPVYVYVLLMSITEMLNLQPNISLKVNDLFGIISTLIITTVVLYYLFIVKFYNIYETNKYKLKNSISASLGNVNVSYNYSRSLDNISKPKDKVNMLKSKSKDNISKSKDYVSNVRDLSRDYIPNVRDLSRDYIPNVRDLSRDYISNVRDLSRDYINRDISREYLSNSKDVTKDHIPFTKDLSREYIPNS